MFVSPLKLLIKRKSHQAEIRLEFGRLKLEKSSLPTDPIRHQGSVLIARSAA
jgi:hypothetical protein